MDALAERRRVGLSRTDGRQTLSRSLLSGLLVLSCFPYDGGYLGIAELARMLDMNTSTTHRYVTTCSPWGCSSAILRRAVTESPRSSFPAAVCQSALWGSELA